MNNSQVKRIHHKLWYARQKVPYGRIYEIKNTETGENYIGFSCNNLKKVLSQYTAAARGGKTGLLYDNIREFGRRAFIIEELYRLTADDLPDITKGKWIRQFRPLLNKIDEQDELIAKVEAGIPKRYWPPEEEAMVLAQLSRYDRRLLKKSINEL